jgi:hypothetical protein
MKLRAALGWIAWGVLLVITVALTFDAIYRPLTEDSWYSFPFTAMVLLWWILLTWTRYHYKFNKLHLFWLAPLAEVLADHGTTYSFLLHANAACFPIVLFGWIAILWWLTPYPIVCPHCKSDDCRRSHLKNSCERLISWPGLRPFRCRTCNQRFWRIGKIIPRSISPFRKSF